MRGQRGQATVEFALIVPLLLVLVFLIFEVGRLFGSWLLMTNAAREGARFAAVQCVPANTLGIPQTCTIGQNPTSAIVQQVQQTARFLVVQGTQCTVSGNAITVPAGSTSCVAVTYSQDASTGDGIVTVSAAYQVQTLMPITGNIPFFGAVNYPGYQPVYATSSMRLEQ